MTTKNNTAIRSSHLAQAFSMAERAQQLFLAATSFDSDQDAPDLEIYIQLLGMAGAEIEKCRIAFDAHWQELNKEEKEARDEFFKKTENALISVESCCYLMKHADYSSHERGVEGDVIPSIEYLYHNSLDRLIDAMDKLYQSRFPFMRAAS